ncbi:MAG: helix-turn-helix domain-containing protein [Bacilli bacterium]
MASYTTELKEEIVNSYLEGKTIRILSEEYNINQSTINYWIKKQIKKTQVEDELKINNPCFLENKVLKKQIEELKMEIFMLNRSLSFIAKLSIGE